MEKIKRYTIEACRDYSDCWLDVSEAIEQDYLTEELYCKDADVKGLEKQISDHKAVVEKYKKNDQKMVDIIVKQQNKIYQLEKLNESLRCCGNCRNNVAGTNKCIKDVFSIKCFYKDPESGLKGYWESDSEGIING